MININYPKHLAIIMDGNRRWAELRGFDSSTGHKKGAQNLKGIIKKCIEFGIEETSIFAFSTENWKRLPAEVNYIFKLVEWYLKSEIAELNKNNICLKIIGERKNLKPSLIKSIDNYEKITSKNTGMKLNVAINYGGKLDIVHAVKSISEKIINNKLTVNKINEKTINDHLISHSVSDIDFLIRTSGEMRISNFMIWQLVYSELYFTNTLWPDFTTKELYEALIYYSKRPRRFGSSSLSKKEKLNRLV